jgi:hypothetical protein
MEVAGGRRKPSGRDRLSNLPDCLLHGILSQLRSRQAVQTCVLSRRWTHLWRAASCIHINSADFTIEASSYEAYLRVKEEEALAKLEEFADSLLLRRDPSASSSPDPELPLDALRLRVHGGGPRGDVNMGRWIRRGLKLSPAALDVSGGDGYPVNLTSLPHCVSGGGTRRLTRLRLHNVLLHGDFGDLLGPGGLPVLEDLEIINAVLVSEICKIASDTLISLAVVDASCHHDESRCSVLITAPRLASLRLEFPLARLTSIAFNIDRACLSQASIRLLEEADQHHQPWRLQDDHHGGDDEDGQPDVNFDDKIRDLCYLIDSLSSVTSLHLSGFHETVPTYSTISAWSIPLTNDH